MSDEYTTIRIPKKLTDQIDRIIEEGISGYTSRAEFVKDAVRRRIEELEKH